MKKTLIMAVSAASLIFFTGCSSDEPQIESPKIPGLPNELPSFDLSDSELEIAESLDDFGFRLLNSFAEMSLSNGKKENIVISPLSAAFGLSILANSVEDEEAEKIVNLLGNHNIDLLNAYNTKLIKETIFHTDDGVLAYLNNVWVDNSFSLYEGFRNKIDNLYGTSLKQSEFASGGLVDEINLWAQNSTAGYVSKIVDKVKPEADAVFANSIYFRSKWKTRYDVEETATFHGTHGDTEVQIMTHNDNYHTYYGSEFEGIKIYPLDYASNSNIIIILPPEGTDIFEFASKFTYDDYKFVRQFRIFYPHSIVGLPRFVEESHITLDEYLKANGIRTNLSLSSMGENKENGGISLLHSASVEFGMEGIYPKDDQEEPDEPQYWSNSRGAKHESIDRPFMFFVQEHNSKAYILAGIISDL